MIQTIFTLDDLKEIGLTIVGSYQTAESYGVKVGEYYLQSDVVSMWDWKDYSDYYTYFDDYKHLVYLCFRKDDKTTTKEPLKKDFSNIPQPTATSLINNLIEEK